MSLECKTCLNSGFVSGCADRMPWPVVERKAKERDVWKDLDKRLPKLPCPLCSVSPQDRAAALLQSATGTPVDEHPLPTRRRRKPGRPRGSKNKPKTK